MNFELQESNTRMLFFESPLTEVLIKMYKMFSTAQQQTKLQAGFCLIKIAWESGLM